MFNRKAALSILVGLLAFCSSSAFSQETAPFSKKTKICIACHQKLMPGVVADWEKSTHSMITPADALKKPELQRMLSSSEIPEELSGVAVGCYECHSLNDSSHADNFTHFGMQINVVVSPEDCRTCHEAEVEEYSLSKKANAVANLDDNPIYHTLYETILTTKEYSGGKLVSQGVSEETKGDACFACHGTKVTVSGMETISTSSGDIEVPVLENWPNQGVGRINPDGSKGSCTSCHPRHSFSLEISRKPFTCAECHLTPDVPAWNVYRESKHGNIFLSMENSWNWNAVPWKVGEDFTAPTCAVCHAALITDSKQNVLAERTHNFGSRLWVRLFGLIYAHAQPISGDTTIIKNKDGLPLPTAFDGTPASGFLISAEEQDKRLYGMKTLCRGCHSSSWARNHFEQLNVTIKETNEMTSAATGLIAHAWEKGIADKTNPFDEEIEQYWVKQWLFYANSARYASAMGGQDYAAFKNGWWSLTNTLAELEEEINDN